MSPSLTEPLSCRPAEEKDLPVVLKIRNDAGKLLARQKVDQWQGTCPGEEDFHREITAGECFVVLHGEEIAAFFSLSPVPEPSYENIRDGKWTEIPSYAVLRHAAVAEAYRGSGMAEAMLRLPVWKLRNRGDEASARLLYETVTEYETI